MINEVEDIEEKLLVTTWYGQSKQPITDLNTHTHTTRARTHNTHIEFLIPLLINYVLSAETHQIIRHIGVIIDIWFYPGDNDFGWCDTQNFNTEIYTGTTHLIINWIIIIIIIMLCVQTRLRYFITHHKQWSEVSHSCRSINYIYSSTYTMIITIVLIGVYYINSNVNLCCLLLWRMSSAIAIFVTLRVCYSWVNSPSSSSITVTSALLSSAVSFKILFAVHASITVTNIKPRTSADTMVPVYAITYPL